MIVILDRQHHGKPSGVDPGATHDLDGDGTIDQGEWEATLTPRYIGPAKDYLEARGHQVFVLDAGYYSRRHREACRLAILHPEQRCAYVACHINAGGGDHALCVYDRRSRAGADLSKRIMMSMSLLVLPHVDRYISSSTERYPRARVTISGVGDVGTPRNLSGVCFEPYFLDNSRHSYLSHTERSAEIGEALARGLISWGENG